jgi:hypothetical protein
MSGTFQGRVAFASIRYTGAVPAIINQSGDFGAITALVGAGECTIVLLSPIDPDEAFISFGCRGLAGEAHVAAWTDTLLTVHRTNSAGAGADRNYDLTILVKPSN